MMRKNYEQFVDILTDIEPVIAKKQIQGGHKVISQAETCPNDMIPSYW